MNPPIPSTATNASSAAIMPVRADIGDPPCGVDAEAGGAIAGSGRGGGCTRGDAAGRCPVDAGLGAAICDVALLMLVADATAAGDDEIGGAGCADAGDVGVDALAALAALALGKVVPHCTQNLAAD
jgi:hypothetical protein